MPILYGCKPDKNARFEPVGRRYRAPIAGSTDRILPTGPVLDQQNSDCVAHWLADSILTCRLAQGFRDSKLPSRRWIYHYTLKREGRLDEDDGCSPWDAVLTLQQKGFCSEDFWSYAKSYRDGPSLDAMEHAFDQKNKVKVRWCPDVADVAGAIWRGFSGGFALKATDALEAYTGGVWNGEGEFRGLHMVEAMGVKNRLFLCKNSWSPGWGENGYFWMSMDAANNREVVVDKYVTDVAPGFSESK